MRKKVTVVGSGNVGATTALRLAQAELCDVVMTDIMEGIPQGKALDMMQAGPITGSDSRITGTNDYKDTANSDVVVVTAGFPRTPGMSRDDLLMKNYEVIKATTEKIIEYSPNTILVMVTNPLDAMCQAAFRVSKFPRERVIGMAGVLDSARFRTFLAEAADVSVENVQAFVLGGHGDDMVPVVSYSNIGGIPLTDLLDKATLEAIVKRTRGGGGEIVKYLKTGSAFYAPSAAVFEMVESILKDKKKILPCAAFLTGEYGIKDLFVGVPCKLGAKGIEKIYDVKLTKEETEALNKSAESVRELVKIIGC
jgi:malate dehydrogenase